MNEAEEILCILVVYPDGSECFEPMRDYYRNPPVGTWIKKPSVRYRSDLEIIQRYYEPDKTRNTRGRPHSV